MSGRARGLRIRVMQRSFVLAFGLVGCGVVVPPPALDAPVEPDASSPDAPDAPPSSVRCSPSAPFTSVVQIDEVSSPLRDDRAILSSDELEMYVTRFTSGTAEIMRARRSSVAATWGAPVRVPALNTHSSQGADAISSDGRDLYITAFDGTSDQIMVATRASTAVEFGPASPVANINSSTPELWATIDPSNLVLHFVSHRSNPNPNGQVFRAERASTGLQFEPPVVVGNTDNMFLPIITMEGLGLYYSRLQTGGKFVSFFASRGSITEPFGPGVPHDELTPVQGGWLSWMSADQCRALLIREGTAGDLDVHFATRTADLP